MKGKLYSNRGNVKKRWSLLLILRQKGKATKQERRREELEKIGTVLNMEIHLSSPPIRKGLIVTGAQ